MDPSVKLVLRKPPVKSLWQYFYSPNMRVIETGESLWLARQPGSSGQQAPDSKRASLEKQVSWLLTYDT